LSKFLCLLPALWCYFLVGKFCLIADIDDYRRVCRGTIMGNLDVLGENRSAATHQGGDGDSEFLGYAYLSDRVHRGWQRIETAVVAGSTPVIHPLITAREEYPGFTELMSAKSVDLVVMTGLRGSGRWMARQGHLTVLGVSKPLTQQSKKNTPS